MKIRNLPKQAKKAGVWLLKLPEKKLVALLLPLVPSWVETYHLTGMTIGWMILAVAGGYLAEKNLNFLGLTSLAIVGQYLTDLLDGAVGRARNTGLIKWGFYADHILDFGFLCSILVGYWFVTPSQYHYVILATLILSGAYFVHTILYFGATGKYEIASMGIGPTETRLVLVVINTMLALFDKIVFMNFLKLFFWFNAAYMIITIYTAQRKLWEIDMKNK